jgi:hypothetical protein
LGCCAPPRRVKKKQVRAGPRLCLSFFSKLLFTVEPFLSVSLHKSSEPIRFTILLIPVLGFICCRYRRYTSILPFLPCYSLVNQSVASIVQFATYCSVVYCTSVRAASLKVLFSQLRVCKLYTGSTVASLDCVISYIQAFCCI